MLKRISLVWKRAGLSDAAFRRIWLGEHAQLARRLEGLRGYSIAFPESEDPAMPDGIATTLFDSRAACERAFADKELVTGLMRTREDFAGRVVVAFADETTLV